MKSVHKNADFDSNDRLMEIYYQLFKYYGPQHWWPAKGRFEVIVGAILTQATSWNNVKKAITNLKLTNTLHCLKLGNLPLDKLARLIHSSGYYNAKARKIKAFVTHLHGHYNGNLDLFLPQSVETLRQELLSIYGIGPETADSIILYAAEKPIFVVDMYTRRILSRLGMVAEDTKYKQLQSLFMDNLPHKLTLFKEYHALMVRHASSKCRKIPICSGCPICYTCQMVSEDRQK